LSRVLGQFRGVRSGTAFGFTVRYGRTGGSFEWDRVLFFYVRFPPSIIYRFGCIDTQSFGVHNDLGCG